MRQMCQLAALKGLQWQQSLRKGRQGKKDSVGGSEDRTLRNFCTNIPKSVHGPVGFRNLAPGAKPLAGP